MPSIHFPDLILFWRTGSWPSHLSRRRNSKLRERGPLFKNFAPPPPRGFPLRLEDHAGQPEIFSLVSPLASRIDL